MNRPPRLRPGDVVRFDRHEWLVERVTPAAARCSRVDPHTVTIGERTFQARNTRVTYISPESDVEIVRHVDLSKGDRK